MVCSCVCMRAGVKGVGVSAVSLRRPPLGRRAGVAVGQREPKTVCEPGILGATDAKLRLFPRK